ncbi:CLUMA_CG010466, isoform A [Clunio marinus]|uniref:CLUMA_CG010466, isoform A n=1 Tax=Clunio marinus TaxID=568069 RepID=A0A1J1IBH3_9DIPT|nr:CLUMA_CG010466, isoform A [Clunio marinus]
MKERKKTPLHVQKSSIRTVEMIFGVESFPFVVSKAADYTFDVDTQYTLSIFSLHFILIPALISPTPTPSPHRLEIQNPLSYTTFDTVWVVSLFPIQMTTELYKNGLKGKRNDIDGMRLMKMKCFQPQD